MHPSPWDAKGSVVQGVVRNTRALDGFAVLQDYEQSREGVENMRAHGIFRYDSTRSLYELHWIDSMGGAPSRFEGTLVNGLLHLELHTDHMHMRASWNLSVRDAITYSADISMDGVQWMPFMEGSYRRDHSA